MLDRIEAMSIFVAVADAGSFTGAGRKLNIPLPTVSRKLAELEAHLGTRLLTRSTRRLALTEAGAHYVSDCRRILDEIGDAERKAAGEYVSPKGEILMTAPVAFGRRHVLPAVTAFLATYPDIDVRMMMSDRNTHLLDEHIDLAVRIGRLPDSSLRAAQVGSVSQVVCGSAGYFARHGVPQTPHGLTRLSCITFDSLSPTSSWLFADTDGKEQAVTVRSRLAVSTAEAAVDAAISGLGVTRVLSYQAMEAVKGGKLQVVLAAFQSNPVPVSLLYACHDPLPLKIRSFLDFAVPRLREQAAKGEWDF